MSSYKTPTGEVKQETGAILAYFGRKEGQTVPEFGAELKALSPEDKQELADGAAKELGWEKLS